MSSMVLEQKTSAVSGDNSFLAHDLIDKLAVVVGQCELLFEHIYDAEDMARLKSIAQPAKLMADALNGRHHELAGTREWSERDESDSRDQDHNSE